MTLFVVGLHLLGVIIWMGGLMYQGHVLLPAARRGDARAFAESAHRARPISWSALGLVVLTGLYNVTRLGPLERVMESGAALLLAVKFMLVLLIVAIAGQRDFGHVPRLRRALGTGDDPAPTLGAIARLDRLALLIGVVIVYLGLAVARR